MPQLNPEFFISQLFWLAIFFTFLLVFLWRVSLPRIADVLEKRQNKINENLSLAKELQERSEEIEKNINAQINKAKQDTDEQIKKTISSLEKDTATQLALFDRELDDKFVKSESDILKSRDDQMRVINDEVMKITKITLSKITDLKITDSDINDSVKSFKGLIN